jgi:hypothetical protein
MQPDLSKDHSPINSQNHSEVKFQMTDRYNNLQINEMDTLLNQTFEITADILVRQVAHEAILLHMPTSTYYSLNETSLVFWQAIEQQQSLHTALEKIIAEYDVDRAQVLDDLQILLQDLLNFGLISLAKTKTKTKAKTNL